MWDEWITHCAWGGCAGCTSPRSVNRATAAAPARIFTTKMEGDTNSRFAVAHRIKNREGIGSKGKHQLAF